MIDQIAQLAWGFEKLFAILWFDIVANLVSLVLNSEGSELFFDLLLGNFPLSDFSVSLKTEYMLNLVFFNEFSDFLNINRRISYNYMTAIAFLRYMMGG